MARAAQSLLKEMTMELGGKAPPTIFDDADPARAAGIAMTASFYSSGQVCDDGTTIVREEIFGPVMSIPASTTRRR